MWDLRKFEWRKTREGVGLWGNFEIYLDLENSRNSGRSKRVRKLVIKNILERALTWGTRKKIKHGFYFLLVESLWQRKPYSNYVIVFKLKYLQKARRLFWLLSWFLDYEEWSFTQFQSMNWEHWASIWNTFEAWTLERKRGKNSWSEQRGQYLLPDKITNILLLIPVHF